MIIIGNGQIAKLFSDYYASDVCLFASGVSDSKCEDDFEFNREKKLLLECMEKYPNYKFIYFSSCALSASSYPKNQYYLHKQNMEEIIQKNVESYYIFRLPQVFGDLKQHSTLINYIYTCIKDDIEFEIYDKAYRYVIEINDIKIIVDYFLKNYSPSIVANITNPFRYKVLDLVKIIEYKSKKRGIYKIVSRSDGYFLENSNYINETMKLRLRFGKDYFYNKLKI
ncbi:NAD(P)-dependent oxidoreductase [Campylobacter lari]|uniref:NAD(P)-dependent oxidoreductase n=1 Tax=Campylobacter lari TaxID=201 RepID=UPI003728D789